MSSVDATLQLATQRDLSGPRGRGRGGGRRGRRNQPDRGGIHNAVPGYTITDANVSLALRPASLGPSPNVSSAELSSAEVFAAENGTPNISRGQGTNEHILGREARVGSSDPGEGRETTKNSRRTRDLHANGHGGSTNSVQQNLGTTVGSSRQFVGRLTQDEKHLPPRESNLQPDAPEFHPGQQHQSRPTNSRGGKAAQTNHRQLPPKAPRARRQSLLKSTAPDIAMRTHEDIDHGIYECPICTNEVARSSKEVKCNASRTSEGNTKKTLSCDDECARLARNQKLALALNIDPEAHKDDHIPYSNDTLKMFRENTKWAQVQEREIRVFAADELEKRLRLKPMPPHQRAFIHALSEDFGFDSESMDPEPHRHVAIFKTPRFVMAPMKTLAECVRIRVSAEAANSAVVENQMKMQTSNMTYNGFLLSHLKFGLTLEELRAEFATTLDSTPGLAYDISFLPSEEVVIKTHPALISTAISMSAIEAALKALKPALSTTASTKHLATSFQLCTLDPSLNILRRESDDPANNGGWSQVAAKAAAPRTLPRQMAVGEKSVYTVLGSKLREAKRKKEEAKKMDEDVVDDWEEQMRKEEAEEKRARAEELRRFEEASRDVDASGGADEAEMEMKKAVASSELDGQDPNDLDGWTDVVA
ncbi:Transcriptional repressor NF-X1 [Puttea exsequens]|nr:Transcriptional repressor NF-X1 [Puttea exsequens]